ncbi:hypothetical protein BDN67DRAFT_1014817 [Paxillus ammoniavirescens]|nr:hypothetical protein BDN67DRAFT_1014817 [Paxillus ammoniavirescens]
MGGVSDWITTDQLESAREKPQKRQRKADSADGETEEEAEKQEATEQVSTDEEGFPTMASIQAALDSFSAFDARHYNDTGNHLLTVSPFQAQLLQIGWYPATQKSPRTTFTFQSLESFRLMNLECKVKVMSFYKYLRRVTDPIVPHSMPDQYKEFLRISRQWRYLQNKLGFRFAHDSTVKVKDGDLAYFCPACPQPGVNLSEDWMEDLGGAWKYSRSFVMDGNFSTEHIFRSPTTNSRNPPAMSTRQSIRFMLPKSILWLQGSEPSPVLGMDALCRTPWLTSKKANGKSTWTMCFAELWASWRECREPPSSTTSPSLITQWIAQAQEAQSRRFTDVTVMDIFDVQLQRAPTWVEIQLQLAEDPAQPSLAHGIASWLSLRLKIEELQLRIAGLVKQTQLDNMIDDFSRQANQYLAEDILVGQGNTDSDWHDVELGDKEILPLPSNIGANQCRDHSVRHLVDDELRLQQSQANKALHNIQIDLSHWSFLYRTAVRQAKHSQEKKSRAWDAIHQVNVALNVLATP